MAIIPRIIPRQQEGEDKTTWLARVAVRLSQAIAQIPEEGDRERVMTFLQIKRELHPVKSALSLVLDNYRGTFKDSTGNVLWEVGNSGMALEVAEFLRVLGHSVVEEELI